MSIYQHLVIHVPPRSSEAVGQLILDEGVPRIESSGGRLFGVFKTEIGLSRDHCVALVEWPDQATGAAHASELLAGIEGLEVERDEVWEPTLRPAPGATIEPTAGVFSHRWFDVADADFDRFIELTDTAWNDWEAGAKNYVLGLWRSHSAPAPGQTRIWLMAWYQDLATWEGSRFWNKDASNLDSGDRQMSERNELVLDRAVSMLWRLS